MNERDIDDEMMRQMLDWLSRGMDESGEFPEAPVPPTLELSEEDCVFLRERGIAIPQ